MVYMYKQKHRLLFDEFIKNDLAKRLVWKTNLANE